MTEVNSSNKTLFKYLGWTFGLGWGIQVVVWFITGNAVVNDPGNSLLMSSIAQMIMAAMMFVPLLAVLLSGEKLKGMGWKPWISGNVRTLLFAWFMPAILTAIGTTIYFLIFPTHLDLTGEALIQIAGPEVLEQMTSQGITYPAFVALSMVSVVTSVPIVNALVSVGEEAGWRGYMYPVLKEKFGKTGGRIIGGIIWGMWHWPLILLMGFKFGSDYIGAPVLGLPVFCISLICIGIICDYAYEKTGCIWYPSIIHGELNAAASVTLVMTTSKTAWARLLGPSAHGLLAGVPIMICAVLIVAFGRNAIQRKEVLG